MTASLSSQQCFHSKINKKYITFFVTAFIYFVQSSKVNWPWFLQYNLPFFSQRLRELKTKHSVKIRIFIFCVVVSQVSLTRTDAAPGGCWTLILKRFPRFALKTCINWFFRMLMRRKQFSASESSLINFELHSIPVVPWGLFLR